MIGTTCEGADLRFVGPAAPKFTPNTFTYRGKPGDTFNPSGSDKVTVTNTGPTGSLLYWCKRNASGTCSPDLTAKYGQKNSSGQYVNKPIGSGGLTSDSLVVSDPAGNKPSCPADPTQGRNADFVVEYKVSNAATNPTQTIPVKVKCTSLAFAWYQGLNTFSGPSDLCRVFAAIVTIQTNVTTLGVSNVTAKVDGAALSGNNISISYNAGQYLVIGNNHCNYSMGTHTLNVEFADPDDSSKLLGTASGTFTVQDNRWTVALANSTDNCTTVPGFALNFKATAPGETDQNFTNVAPGSGRPLYMRADKIYTVVVSDASNNPIGTTTLNFPSSPWGASLPLNIGYSTYKGVNAHAAYGITQVCPNTPAPQAASRLGGDRFLPSFELSNTRWKLTDGLRPEPVQR